MTTLSLQPPARPRYPASISEVESLVSALEAAGCDVGPRVARVFDAHAAVIGALDADVSRHCQPGLLDLEPERIAQRVRLAAGDVVASRDPMASRVGPMFMEVLAADAASAVRDASENIFIAATLRPRFMAALAVIETAARTGLTSADGAASIVESGNTKQLTAYRQLADAVRILDEVAALRDQLTQRAGVGPVDHVGAAYLPVGATLGDLAAFDSYADEVERRQHVDPVWLGVGTRDVVVHRTGGRWLAAITGGLELTLNTGPEADAVLAAAEAMRDEQAADEGEAEAS